MRVWMIVVVALLVLGGSSARAQQLTDDEEALRTAISLIEERFPGATDHDALYRAAIEGVAAHLDTVVGQSGNRLLTEDEYAGIQAWMRGERTGIGVEFSIIPSQGLLITDVYHDTPAARQDLQVGDVIVAMDNRPFTGLSSQAIHESVRLAGGRQVVLDLRRKNGQLRRITVAREAYVATAVRVVSKRDPAQLRISFFGEGAAEQLARALASLGDAPAVAIDLRDSRGGLLDEAVAAADLFLPPGSVVVHRVTADGEAEPIMVSGERVWDGSVVIIANRGTEGAAEAFVAALQDHRAAMVVGTYSAGRSSLPGYHPIGSGLVFELHDTWMQGPSGRVWTGTGIEPDVLVEPMDLSLPSRPGQPPLDLQRDAAIRLMAAPPR